MQPRNLGNNKVVLSVYFNGTDARKDDQWNLAGFMAAATQVDGEHQMMTFNGCGVDFGLRGMLFGTGTDIQAKQVADRVITLLKEDKRVIVNAYGLSRGAVSCLLLAKMLGHFDQDLVEVNLALMDPVPGNLVTSSKIDFTHRTLARQSMDVSKSRNLKNVLAIYPHEPLPSYAFHAPIFPTYPSSCQVTEEVIPGCHAGAQFMSHDLHEISTITQGLVVNFMSEHGTKLNKKLMVPDSEMKSAFDYYLENNRSVNYSRPCHAKYRTRVVTKAQGTYFSPLHSVLADQCLEPGQHYATKIVRSCLYKNPFTFPKPKAPVEELLLKFTELLKIIYRDKLSVKSRDSEKGRLMQSWITMLDQGVADLTEQKLKDIMRNAFALCLQRDRNSFSPITLTRSGKALKSLLNETKYHGLRELVLNKDSQKLNYNDLRYFIQGKIDSQFYKSRNAQETYGFFNENKDTPVLVTNNERFYLRK